MEEWQISCITANLPKLIQNTTCNVLLLANLVASHILSDSDKLDIESEKHPHKKAAKLFDFVKTRKNGLSSLAKALRDCKQTGALEILKSSFLQQDVKKVLSTTCNSDDFKYLLARIPDSLLQKEVQLHKEEYVDVCIFQENQIEFVINTIPEYPPYYVPRSISNRLQLDPKIFKVQCHEVFVFKDIERHRLSKLVRPLGTESSSRQTDGLTCKFIHLSDEADFLVICQNSNGKPVHLIKYEILTQQEKGDETVEECYILEESHGNSEVLRKFLHKNINQDRCFVSEDDFIHNIESDDQFALNSYCICDSPGSGKTWLLASLARKMKVKHFDRIMVFQKFSEMVFSTDDHVVYLVSTVCPNPLISAIIKAAVIDGNIKMEVFLDALDEVEFEQVETAKRFIRSSKTASENIRLFVTSRPHMRHELESALGVVAYDIRPFDKQNQLDFLEQCWRTSISVNIDASRLKIFASACQAKVQTSLSPQEKDIMGIPLQCYMLAEIYLRKAKMYCKSSKTALNQFLESPVSLFEMYKQFITLKLQKLMSPKNDDGKRTKCFHTWKALEIFSQELAVLYKQVFLPDELVPDLQYLSSGILQGIINIDNRLQISFVHQTLAEYLVAEFISDILTGMQNSHENFSKLIKGLMKYVANEVFQFDTGNHKSYSLRLNFSPRFCQRWPQEEVYYGRLRSTVIPFFLNEHLSLAFSSDSRNIVTSYCLLENLRPNQLFQIMLNSVEFGWFCLIKLFTRLLELAKGKLDIILWYKSVLLVPELGDVGNAYVERPVLLLSLAAKYSNLSVIKHCVQFYEECLEYNCINAIRQTPVWAKTPYHEALERGDYSMVEYFMQFKLPFGNRWLLHQCIYNSRSEDVAKVDAKIQILSLLLNDDEHLIWDLNHANVQGPLDKSLLATPKINLKIKKHLVSRLQENMQTSYSPVLAAMDFETIKNASRCMRKKELHELCRTFFEDLNITRTTKTKQQLVDALKSMLQRQDLELQTLQKVLEQFSSAEISDVSFTLLYRCTVGNQSSETFEWLVKNGVNLFATDNQGFSILHCAAKFGNQNILKYLIRKGHSVNQPTTSGKTPLMLSAENCPEMLLFLLQNGANISPMDQYGETFLHKLAQKMLSDHLNFSPDSFHELVTFLVHQPAARNILKSKGWMQIWTAIRETSYNFFSNIRAFCKKSTLLLLREKLELDYSDVILGAIKNKMGLEFNEGLLECGANINNTNKNGQNALHIAVSFTRDWQIVAYILNKSKLPINEKDIEGNTPLSLCCGHNYVDLQIAELLLMHGADPFGPFSQKNETFAHVAAKWTSKIEFCELISLLLKHTHDSDVLSRKNGNGETLLHARLKNKNESLGNFTLNLIKHNPTVDVNFADNFGDTIFLLLAKNGKHWDLVKFLAEAKVCITSIKNNKGYGVLHFAAKQGNIEMVKYFQSLELPIDDETTDGDTPILLAYQHLCVIEYLYTKGGDICAVNKKGKTILHMAAETEGDTFVDLVQFLRKCKVTQPFVQIDLEFRRSAIHQLLFRSRGLPNYLVDWIISLPNYDISAEDVNRNTIFQTAFKNFQCLETCAIDAIYNAYFNSVKPKAFRCALVKALDILDDRMNLDAVGYLLKVGANPSKINCLMPFKVVMRYLRCHLDRTGCKFFQLYLILKEFLTHMLTDKNILRTTDNQGNTFFHDIATYSDPDDFRFIIAEICKRGSNDILNIKNKSGKTPLQIAEKNNRFTY